jgi:hypothetical protein
MYFPSKKPDLIDKNIIKICMKKLQKENPGKNIVRFAQQQMKQEIIEPIKQEIIEPIKQEIIIEPKVITIEQNQVDLIEPTTNPCQTNIMTNKAIHCNQHICTMQPLDGKLLEPSDSIMSNMGNICIIVKNNTFDFIKDNYGFVLIIILLCILLYIRYIEVQNKKNKKKNNI